MLVIVRCRSGKAEREMQEIILHELSRGGFVGRVLRELSRTEYNTQHR